MIKNINIIDITKESDPKFDEFYKGAAYTCIGCSRESIDSYVKVYLDTNEGNDIPYCGGLKDSVDVYCIEGSLMNKKYNLRGDNAYLNELLFVVIPLEFFNNISKLAIFRISMDPGRMKWFNDLVDNNKRRNIN